MFTVFEVLYKLYIIAYFVLIEPLTQASTCVSLSVVVVVVSHFKLEP